MASQFVSELQRVAGAAAAGYATRERLSQQDPLFLAGESRLSQAIEPVCL